MKIIFSPVRFDDSLALERVGDSLVINGEVFDFSTLPDGATLPRDAITSGWFKDDVRRVDGALIMTLALPHGPNAPDETRFAQPVDATSDGPIALPPFDIEPDEEVVE